VLKRLIMHRIFDSVDGFGMAIMGWTRAIAAPLLLLVAIIGGSGARAQTVVLSDNFTGTSAAQAWQVYDGACLTAGNNSGTIPACAAGSSGGLNGNAPDTAGNGVLRLTQAVQNGRGMVVSLNSFPASSGFTVSFTAVSYGGDGADGIAFFLLDASAGIPAAAGYYGGGLGYAQVVGGYIGIGLDEWGNFENPGCGGGGCIGGPGNFPNSIGVRGSTANGNAWIGGATTGVPSLWSNVPTRATATSHNWVINLTSAGVLSVQMDGVTRISSLNVFAQAGAIPSFLRIGFSASTGLYTNIHAIRSFSVTTTGVSNLQIAKGSTIISDPVNGTTNPKMIPGAVVRYCIQVSNLTGNPTATGISVTDPLGGKPLTFVPGSLFVNGTTTSGVCNWNGTAGGSYSGTTVTAPLSNLAGGQTRTVYFDAVIN
jgi:uncharacterized repeat protein (TIGR01451 family)